MEAELDLQPSLLHQCRAGRWARCWWLQRIITILNPLPSRRRTLRHFWSDTRRGKWQGSKKYLQLKKKKIQCRKMSLNEQIKQRMQQQKSSKR